MYRRIAVVLLVCAMLPAIGCGGSGEDIESEAQTGSPEPVLNVSAGIDMTRQNSCRANMMTLATTMEIYYAGHGCYPDDLEDLREVGGTRLKCPSCDIQYRLEVTNSGEEYVLTCPDVPSHGGVSNGNPDWN